MKLQVTLATATALGLLMGGSAWADSNWTSVKQNGEGNSASVTQDSAGSGNQTRILQGQASAPGDRNAVMIKQTGSSNLAGFQHYSDHEWTLRQYGHDNLIDIEQTGKSNEVGQDNGNRYPHSNRVAYGGARGVQQTGSMNVLTIDQTNPGHAYSYNVVGAVRQTGDINATATTNELTILQEAGAPPASHAPRHLVGLVKQTNTGDGSSAGLKNSVDIHQIGGGFMLGNDIYNVEQNGTSNSAELDQDGQNNQIDVVSQAGTANITEIVQDGSNNGVGSFDPWSAAGAVAGDNPLVQIVLDAFSIDYDGVEQGTLIQNGAGNMAVYTAIGDGNLFGIAQDGDGNQLGGLSEGDGNAAAVVQYGDGNVADFLQDGDDNDTGIFQQGGNTAEATVDGNRNHAAIGQYGSGNDGVIRILDSSDNIAAVIQAGGDDNDAEVEIEENSDGNIAAVVQVLGNDNDASIGISDDGDGNLIAIVQGFGDNNSASIELDGDDGNVLAALQLGSNNGQTWAIEGSDNFAVAIQAGDSNTASIAITGSSNNWAPFANSFTGAAAGAAAADGTSVGDLVPDAIETVIAASPFAGLYDAIDEVSMLQPGLMTQVGAGNSLSMTVNGNSNLFSTLQHGDGNAITHTIGGTGDSNQAAIVQLGNNNISNTSQTGSGNNVGVVQ